MNAPQQFGEGSVVVTRVFDAPRALVWRAWTEPKMLAQWFGPRGFTSSVPELDLRVGGALRIVMHGPDGNDYPMQGVFREIVPPNGWCSAMSPSTMTATTCLRGDHRHAERAKRQDHADGEIARSRPGADRAANAGRHGSGLDAEHR